MSLTKVIEAIAAKQGVDLEKYVCSPERLVEIRNKAQGNLKGYDCKLCNNKGFISDYKDGKEIETPCKCLEIRHTLRLAKKCGAYNLLKINKFSNFEADHDFQKRMLSKAKSCVDSEKWFYIGGQSGCGKTHICTALFGALIKKGYTARYITWRKEAAQLKRKANDSEYDRLMDEYKGVKVLYIDDFLKVKNGKNGADITSVKDADINVAFELIDYRANQPGKITIISSEFPFSAVIDIDEATAGRIKQKCGDYVLTVQKDIDKNFRLMGENRIPDCINGTNPSYDIEELESRGMNVPEA